MIAALAAGLLLAPATTTAARLTIVGVEESPGSYVDDDGHVQGIAVDYVREIQRRVGNRDRIRLVSESEALHLAGTQPNVVAFSFSRTGQRENSYHWIAQVFRKPWVLYVRQQSPLKVTVADDMRRIGRIGVTRGDIRAQWLQQEHYRNLVLADTPLVNLANLFAGRVDAILFEPHGTAYYCRQAQCPPGEPKALFSPRSSDAYILMSLQTPEATVVRWQEAAAQIRYDGTFERIARRWMGRIAADYGTTSEFRDGVLIFR